MSSWILNSTVSMVCMGLILACLIVGFTESALADPPSKQTTSLVPDTPAGKRFSGWLQALNRGNYESIQRFMEESLAPEALKQMTLAERIGRHLEIARNAGGLEVREVVKSSPEEIQVLLQTRLTEMWQLASLQVTPEAPYRILRFGFQSGQAPASIRSGGKLTEAQILHKLDVFLNRLVKADAFSGAIRVEKDGKPLYEKAFGLASRAWNAPNRVDTKFNLGSMNKMFTSVAIAQLVEQGKLSYEDTVSKILPDYPNKEVASRVTVHHLLTHTSGIGDYFNEKFWEASRDRFRAIQDYFPLFVDKPLEFTPGAQFRYSNAGFMVLGAIVEKVSGQDYFDYVREHLYKPAGMIHTDAYELDRDTPNLATGYTRNGLPPTAPPEERRNNLFLHVIKGGPAGGGYSTVADLCRFAGALRKHTILSAPYVEKITAGKVADAFGPNTKYAYGFIEEAIHGQRVVGHSGGFPGINSNLDIFLDSGYTVAVMTNYDQAAQLVAAKLQEWLTQQ